MSLYQTKACATARSDRELGNDAGVENNIDVKDPLTGIPRYVRVRDDSAWPSLQRTQTIQSRFECLQRL